MPRVSRKQLPSVSQAHLWDALVYAITSLQDQKIVADFLLDLLTPVERLMLTKRLAAALLLEEGYSFLKISRSLHLSTATIGSIKRSLSRSGKGYRAVTKILHGRERQKHEAQERRQARAKRIDAFIHALTPPVKGSRASFGRWQRNLKRLSRP